MTDEGCAKNPRLVHKTEPAYPKEARKHGVQGSVTLQARVTEDGTVDEIKVTNAQATDVDFIPSFQDAAVSALGKWLYRPATIKGKPVAFYFTVTMDFML
jgi:protein TonB